MKVKKRGDVYNPYNNNEENGPTSEKIQTMERKAKTPATQGAAAVTFALSPRAPAAPPPKKIADLYALMEARFSELAVAGEAARTRYCRCSRDYPLQFL